MITRYLRPIAAVALLCAFAATTAFAISIDPTRTIQTRQELTQQVSYYRLTVNFNDANIAAGVKFGRLPAQSYILSVDAHVTTVFNAGTTNVLTLGTTQAPANEIVDAATANGSINEASATVQHLTAAPGLGLAATAAGEKDLWVKYTQTGTAATTGSATIIIAFIPNNDF